MLSLILICILSLLFVFLLFKLDRKTHLPPGPKPLPLIGNIHQLPRSSFLALLQKWHRTYGPIVSIQIGTQVVVFLGSHHVAHEIIGKQGAWFSSRPKLPFMDRMMRGPLPISLPYGEEWKNYRRFQHSILNIQTIKSYRAAQDLESKQVLWEMLASDDFEKALARYAYSLGSTLNYGQRIADQDATEIKDAHELFHELIAELFSTNLLFDSIPSIGPYLNWMAGRKNAGGKVASGVHNLITEYINNAIANGAQQNWAQKMLHEASLHSRDHARVCVESFEMYIGASLTTQTSLWIFVLAALLHPDAVLVVQEELDSVIGQGRCPSFEDMPNLPHLNSFVKEVLRWRPILPTGIPYYSTKDSEYEGYRIPKGSIVVASQSAINMDEAMFDEPELFKGDRYMKNPDLPEPASFGYGRRACPGQHLARESLFLVISRLLWAYNIVPHPEDGTLNIDTVRSKTGFIFFWPYPFRARFQVRSPDHQAIIERDFLCKS
ncbi:uncharacterized protein N7529_001053 [Penicillium soppii]|uniref:uncharacterized protein n=1 Tax=Penicillium soppii TaxID=69789 RepID=UPI002548AA78|nr:uncharacterized protein N7529_001053 [Penicillium soppii]KAJ5882381.1 hypothetical protein N7529_001053 [Penicillium soppii]